MTIILAILISTLTLAASQNVSHGQCNLDGLCLGDLVDETRFDFETEAEKRIACISFCRKTPECFWYSLAPYEGLCLQHCETVPSWISLQPNHLASILVTKIAASTLVTSLACAKAL